MSRFSEVIRYPANLEEKVLLNKIKDLNKNTKVSGILVQLPLPKHINTDIILDTIKPNKDVDGFHTINAGNLYLNRKAVIPCTPLGCLIMLRSLKVSLHGLRAVIIGRSNIVGKPMSQLLLKENCTVTVVHSYTKNIKEIVKESDIVVAALGIANYVKESWIKPGSIVIDVGINRIKENGKNKLVGDVEFNKIKNVQFKPSIKTACENSDLIIIHTEWNDFKSIDYKKILKKKNFKIYDMRNIYSSEKMKKDQIKYFSIGR